MYPDKAFPPQEGRRDLALVVRETAILAPSWHQPSALRAIRLALSRAIYYIRRRIAKMWRMSPENRLMGEESEENVLKIVGRYVEIVARHGFDSAKAAEFWAAHRQNMAFVVRAIVHDRMMLRKSIMDEADRRKDQVDWDRGL